jgi:threonine dehydratase
LLGLDEGWNISLFHYRNHGAGTITAKKLSSHEAYCNRIIDLGKVLAGVQVPPEDCARFDEFLDKLGYPYVEETNNDVYKRYFRD